MSKQPLGFSQIILHASGSAHATSSEDDLFKIFQKKEIDKVLSSIIIRIKNEFLQPSGKILCDLLMKRYSVEFV